MSKSTRLLLFVLLGLAGIGIWFALAGGQSDAKRAIVARGDALFVNSNGAHLDVPTPAGGARELLDSAGEVRNDLDEEAPAAVIEPYVTHDLHGTLTLLDEFGNGPFLEDGSFAFWLWQEEETSYHEVQVQRGEWETVLPHGVRISLAEVELGGRVAAFIAEDGPPIVIPPSGYLELEAYLPKASHLRVFASDTGAELDEVMVVVERRRINFRRYPGEVGAENRVVEKASSPIVLPAVSGVRIDEAVTYFIRAHGYGWTSLVMKHSTGGTYEVHLKPAGSLEVHLSEFDPDLFPKFRLWRGGAPFLVSSLSWERDLKFESLAEGIYRASVDIGRDWRNLECLGEAEVQIHAGGITVVDLELRAGRTHERGRLKGIVEIPTEWNLPSFRVLLRLNGEVASARDSLVLATSVELANIPGRENAWRFDFPDMVAGTWKFGVEPTLYAVNVEVTPEESEDLLIEVPPPADWTVRTVDKHTHEPALIEELRYFFLGGYTLESRLAERGPLANEFKVRAPIGRVALEASGGGYRAMIKGVQLDATTGEIDLEVQSECGIVLTARLGRREIAWNEDWRVVAEEAGGDGFTYKSELQNEGLRMFVTQPGEYLVVLKDLGAFDTTSEVRVVVEPGSFVPVQVELVRK